jgi:hypothetical protein
MMETQLHLLKVCLLFCSALIVVGCVPIHFNYLARHGSREPTLGAEIHRPDLTI